MTNTNELARRNLYVFNKRGGKVVKKIEGIGRGMIGMWAFQNITKGRLAILILEDDNRIERVYVGREGCPKVLYLDKYPQYYIQLDQFIIDDTHVDIDEVLELVRQGEEKGLKAI